MTDRPSVRLVLSLLTAGLAVACGKTPPPALPVSPPPVTVTIAAPPEAKVVKATMTLSVSADANPDASGRASPVVLHIYQLKTDGPFRAADYATLTSGEAKAIADVVISHDQFLIRPAEKQSIDVTIANDAAFVGVVAEFRDFRNAQWRAAVAAPRKGLTVAVERARVVVAAVP